MREMNQPRTRNTKRLHRWSPAGCDGARPMAGSASCARARSGGTTTTRTPSAGQGPEGLECPCHRPSPDAAITPTATFKSP